MLRSLRSFVRIFRRSRLERQMADELQFHLERRAADLVASGLTQNEARRRARLEFGPIEAYKDRCREALGLRLLDDLRADLVYISRSVRRSSGFAAVAIASIALGVGANTVVFSVVNALVLRPLSIERPEEVVFVQTANADYPSQRCCSCDRRFRQSRRLPRCGRRSRSSIHR